MKINSVDPASTKPPERSGKTIGNNSQDKESAEDFRPSPSQQKEEEAISPIPTEEEKKKEPATYMPKPPYPQRLKAENKNKVPKKEPKEEKGATNDAVKFQQIQKVPTMPYLPTIIGSNNKTYMITEARRILPALILQADENVFNPIRFQIHQRKWEKFTKPIQAVGHLMVKEFYANGWEPHKAKRKPLTYTSSVRGTEISFAPSIKRVLKLKKDPIPDAPSYHERKANKDYRLDHILEDMCEEGAEWVRHRDGRPHYLRRSDLESMTKENNIVEEIIAEQIYKFVYKMDISSSLPFPSIIAALCVDARIPAIPDDTLIPQEPPIVAEAMARTREARAKNPRQARQATPLQQQPQFQHQQDFSSGFYTHFDTSMYQVYRRLDQQQEENKRTFEAINTRMDRMDDRLSFLYYSNQMANEQMLSPYQNTARQFKEMEMQGIPVTMANLAIHRQREEEIN
ncbi:hypothetical protein PIB30_088565 [Stylosanthes scabra]|uniref:Putative plant transposon protein domain-containing protein n=1 Tax=Stylosanthes scabra TaxID=79078 RepID=A0ABU6XT39_9FABA|nr:hypothetical protein [Stylosanthes scabra]